MTVRKVFAGGENDLDVYRHVLWVRFSELL